MQHPEQKAVGQLLGGFLLMVSGMFWLGAADIVMDGDRDMASWQTWGSSAIAAVYLTYVGIRTCRQFSPPCIPHIIACGLLFGFGPFFMMLVTAPVWFFGIADSPIATGLPPILLIWLLVRLHRRLTAYFKKTLFVGTPATPAL